MDALAFVGQTIILLGAIFLGVRLGGLGIGYAGGLGVLVLGITGLTTDFAAYIPWDVLGIIMAVIGCIAAMQLAGGLDVLVHWAEVILRKQPKYITVLGPIVTFLMTMFAGTGHTAFSTIPVITEVAKESNIRPVRPLTISVVASQIAITASPVSAAVIAFAALLENLKGSNPEAYSSNVGYVELLAVAIPSAFLGVLIIAVIMALTDRKPLDKDPEYQRRLAAGLVTMRGATKYEHKAGAKLSVGIFGGAIGVVMVYAMAISDKIGWIHGAADPDNPGSYLPVAIDRTSMIISVMLGAATLIVILAKVKVAEVLNAPTFKSGMSAALCVLGVAWLGTVFVKGHEASITGFADQALSVAPWLFAVVAYLAAALLYSQAATTKVVMPLAIALGMSPLSMVASFAAVGGLYILPTYPTTVAAAQMDDTGTTRFGKYIFNHPFILPGTAACAASVALGYAIGGFVL
ncbi:MAG: anaerobic C4-dicarboxylate transporter [Bifidobacteriaceae bacterium]|jgi:anaerobic C4-dicarboxylate transporter DcuA|nr:anaerobic C4-dicarboxylate transporter [Bifidobacteriaceae bacterium]